MLELERGDNMNTDLSQMVNMVMDIKDVLAREKAIECILGRALTADESKPEEQSYGDRMRALLLERFTSRDKQSHGDMMRALMSDRFTKHNDSDQAMLTG